MHAIKYRFVIGIFVLLLTFISMSQTSHAANGLDKWIYSEGKYGLRTVYMDRKIVVCDKYCIARISFYSTKHGPINLKLSVAGVSALKGFNFDQFEGPDAEIGQQEAMKIQLYSTKNQKFIGNTGYSASLIGWYSEDLKGGFTFSPNNNKKNTKNLSDMIGRIMKADGTITIIINDPKSRQKAKVEGSYPLYGIQDLLKQL